MPGANVNLCPYGKQYGGQVPQTKTQNYQDSGIPLLKLCPKTLTYTSLFAANHNS